MLSLDSQMVSLSLFDSVFESSKVLFNQETLLRLFVGFSVTLKVALIAIFLSVGFGLLFGVIRTSRSLVVKVIFKLYLELIRIVPLLVWLFVFYFIFRSDFSGEWIGILIFTLWGSAEISDIVRSSIISLPKTQLEAGLAIGLTQRQLLQYVLLPQAIKNAIPAIMNLSARIIMTTSLLVFINVIEVIKVGQQVIEFEKFTNDKAAFWIYGWIAILFFICCYTLSKIADKLAKKGDQ